MSSIEQDMMQLNLVATNLGPRARRLLLKVAERLQVGAQQYGDFERPRLWSLETAEEQLDAISYLTMKLLEEQDGKNVG